MPAHWVNPPIDIPAPPRELSRRVYMSVWMVRVFFLSAAAGALALFFFAP